MRDKDSEIFEFDAQLLSVPEPFFLERARVFVQENLQTPKCLEITCRLFGRF